MDIQAAVEVEAALQARFAKHCAVERCRFTRLGGYAVDFGHGCQDNKIVGCDMWDLGGGGVRLGDSDARRGAGRANISPMMSPTITFTTSAWSMRRRWACWRC
jgi:hypothetical protein